MLNVTFSKDKLLKLISETVNQLMEENRDNFNKNQQVMAPLSSQIAVLSTLQVLNKLGFIVIKEPENNSNK